MGYKAHLVIAIIIIIIINSGLIIPSVAAVELVVINNVSPFASPYGTISVNATSLENVVTLPVYHGSYGENGSINIQFQQIGKERENVTTESEAPVVARSVLEQYGGLPQDAVLSGASTTYIEIFNHDLQKITYKEPMFTTVSYSREINGLWVFGDSNAIILTLGEKGELLRIFKIWRNYTYIGDDNLIPVYTALEKLKRGEVLDEPMVSGEKITIDIATPDYYAKKIGNNDTVLEPIWLLAGTAESGSRVGFYVYARQFANFTASPNLASMSDTITFTDTSEASPDKWYWDFGDGTNATIQNPTHKYSKGGNFTVNLTVWNDMGSDTISRQNYISIYPTSAPVAGFTSNFTWEYNNVPLAVAFNCTTPGNITWLWDFGDGTNSTEPNPVHVYDLPEGALYGSYAPSLTVIDDFGRTSTAIGDWMYFNRRFVMNFSASPTSGSSPLNVTFWDNSTYLNTYSAFRWDFGDGSGTEWTSWDSNPPPRSISHEYTVVGNYSVTLEICYSIDGDICEQIVKDNYIFVTDSVQAPVTGFTANITYGKQPLSVAFTDISDGSPMTWLWDFGDSGVSSKQDPVHIYTTAGNYSVSLTVTNTGGSNTTNKIDYITVLPLVTPDASFTVSPVSGKLPLTVVFNDTSTGSPTTWLWGFGDGTTSTEQHPIHEYTAAGTFTVSLTVTNDNGSDTETRTDYIVVTPLVLPIADFAVNATSGQVPLAVAFTDTSSGTPTSWSWTFGDGGISAEQNPVHVYTTPGQFMVSLQVTNEDGSNSTSKEQYITGSTIVLPAAEFTANMTSGNAPLAVGFTDQSTGSPVSWLWSFGDGATSAEQNPEHIYAGAGTYTVSLDVTNYDGSNTKTKPDYITVTSSVHSPVAIFTGKPTCGKAPLSVKFTDASTGNPTGWYWNFGDGTNSTEQNPVHVYITSGKYSVSLIATNPGGSNTSTKKDYITVSGSGIKPPVANFHGKPTSGKAPLAVTFTDTSTGSPTGWYWEFGDGTNATGRNPVHSYTSPGKYTVLLTVTNAGGSDTTTRTEYITVKGTTPPIANFYGKPTSGKSPLAVTFTDTSTGSPTDWYWMFGDGTTGTTQHPVHTYTAAGKYTVSLTASNAGGNTTKTRTQYITISSPVPTTSPTCTHTQSQCEPHTAPAVQGTIENGKIRLDWDVITNPCLQGYKVVISKNNPNPKYPDDGYMFWITDRSTNHAIIRSADHYNSGDFGGYLQPGQSYYFSITAVYSEAKVAGNVVRLVYPVGTPATTMTTVPTTKPTTTCTTKPTTTCTKKP